MAVRKSSRRLRRKNVPGRTPKVFPVRVDQYPNSCQRYERTAFSRRLSIRVRLLETPRMSVKYVAVAALAACFCLAPSDANAFGDRLGHHRAAGCGCDVAPSCGCEIAMPSCGCEIAPSCGCEVSCDPCCSKRVGLLAKLRARRAARKARKACCDPCASSCCEPAPVCCEPAPVCCDAAPSCGCEVSCDPCCSKRVGFLAKLRARRAARKACCAAPSCCDVAPSCGCEIAPSCGCGH